LLLLLLLQQLLLLLQQLLLLLLLLFLQQFLQWRKATTCSTTNSLHCKTLQGQFYFLYLLVS
jgi:hypothetical protein